MNDLKNSTLNNGPYFLNVIDFIMLALLVTSDLSIWLLQQKIQRADFLSFTEVCLIDVNLSAQDPGLKKQSSTPSLRRIRTDSLFFGNPFIEPTVEPFIVDIILVKIQGFVVPPLDDFSRVWIEKKKDKSVNDSDDAMKCNSLTPRVFSSLHQIVFANFQRGIFSLVFIATFVIFFFRFTSFLGGFTIGFDRLKSFNRHDAFFIV